LQFKQIEVVVKPYALQDLLRRIADLVGIQGQAK
jgi:hypothetical protein